MINCFKSCFSPEHLNFPRINRSAFVPVNSHVNFMKYNEITQQTNNLSSEAKPHKSCSDLPFTHIDTTDEQSVISDVTIDSQIQKKDAGVIAQKEVIQQQKIALIKKYQEQREKGNQFESATSLKKAIDNLKS